MKNPKSAGTPRTTHFKRALLAALLLSTLNSQLSTWAQGTTFTYQGRFTDNGSPYTGVVEVQPTLWDAASGGSQVASNSPVQIAVGVTNGLFVLVLDFAGNFPGADRWLQLEVRTSLGPFTPLTPRQQLTPTPYAMTAGNLTGTLPAVQLSGTVADERLSTSVSLLGRSIDSAEIANGTIVPANLNTASFSNTFWRIGGNAGTNPTNGAFLGTTDHQPLEIKVNGLRALRIEAPTNAFGDIPNIVGGHSGNIVSNGFVGAVIGGGGQPSFPNRVGNNFATVVGGMANTASGFASTAMGKFTTASGDSSTGMGVGTTASGFASTAMGSSTIASGFASTAMGSHARANHEGSFVWADSQGGDFASTADHQFSIRAAGGVRLSDNTPNLSFGSTTRQMVNLFSTAYGLGVQDSTLYQRSNFRFSWFVGGTHVDSQNVPGTGGTMVMTLTDSGLTVKGTVSSSSDRNVKERFEPVNSRDVLEQVAALPLARWSYKEDPGTRHLGPMAQDFYAAFHVGPDDKHIATVDADGVALAAIQGLNQKLEERTRTLEMELKRRDAENAELRQTVNELKELMQTMNRTLNGDAK